jgi:hypothetical protein
MTGVTGIELGPNYCVLVRSGRLGSHRTVSAAAALLPSRWPVDPHALVARLREARQHNDLPSRARVVAWGDRETLAPLVEAGFEIASVLSPAQALARVVRARQAAAPAGMAVAALSLNSHGGAIAIVAGTEVIQWRVFEWPLGTPFASQLGDRHGDKGGRRSELLDRYLIVSQIAPQLQHVIDLVRPAYSATVTSVVLCGNLPNLRSLAMLLIQEMDIEVETLDSAELLDPGVAPGTLADRVASLQLAAAVSSSGENRVPVHSHIEPTPAPGKVAEEDAPRRIRPGARLQSLAALVALAFCTGWSFVQAVDSGPARPIFPAGPAGIEQMVATSVQGQPGLGGVEEPGAEATTGRAGADEPGQVPEGAPGSPPSGDVTEPSVQKPRGPRVASRASQASLPLPTVDGIMIAGTYRLAIVGGTVVAAGDAIGPRAVARIERNGVVLRESSGREIYVAIRLRKPPTLGS